MRIPSTSTRRAAVLAAAIATAALVGAPGAGAEAPSTAFHRGTPPARASVPPLHVRRTMARRLRTEGHPSQARQALKPRRATRAVTSLAGSGIGFRVPTPTAACDVYLQGSGVFASTNKVYTILPPIAYAYDQPSQWVFYQPYVYASATGQIWYLASQQQVATSTNPAPFTTTKWAYGAALPAQSVGMDLWWYSNTRGWMQGRAWDLPMRVATYAGALLSPVVQSRC